MSRIASFGGLRDGFNSKFYGQGGGGSTFPSNSPGGTAGLIRIYELF